MANLTFDDLTVGARFHSDAYEVTQEAIIVFAREFDVQAFHLDPKAADASVFQGLTASGWYTAAIAMRLFTTTLRFEGGAVEWGWTNCAGRSQFGQTIGSSWKRKFSSCGRRVQNRNSASCEFETWPGISAAKSCSVIPQMHSLGVA